MTTLTFVTDNCTGAVPQSRGDAMVLQERVARAWRLRVALGRGYSSFFPKLDRNQALSLRKSVLKPAGRGGYLTYHRSGQAEKSITIATPRRGVTFRPATTAAGTRVMVAGTHLIPDWTLSTSSEAHRIATTLELPVLINALAAWHAAGYVVLLGGDFNVHSSPLELPGMTHVAGKHHDRVFVTTGAVTLKDWHEGPVVGVGPTYKHPSVVATLNLKETP